VRESQYQARLINRIKDMFPGCIILKNDTDYMPGVPDLIILFEDKWAMLEVKREGNIVRMRPNQQYYVDMLNTMSFASFISADNEEDVLYDLQCAWGVIRPPRVS
jgi:hypothetical protein